MEFVEWCMKLTTTTTTKKQCYQGYSIKTWRGKILHCKDNPTIIAAFVNYCSFLFNSQRKWYVCLHVSLPHSNISYLLQDFNLLEPQ